MYELFYKTIHENYELFARNTNYSRELQIIHWNYELFKRTTNYSRDLRIIHGSSGARAERARAENQFTKYCNDKMINLGLGSSPFVL